MNRIFSDTVYRNAYFLIGAAWLFTLSFIFSNYWSYTSSPQGVKKSIEQYLHRQEADFLSVTSDTTLMERLIRQQSTEEELNTLTSKPYGIFLYTTSDFEPYQLAFWNTQQVLPAEQMLIRPDGEYFETLTNGQFELINRTVKTSGSGSLLACALIPVRWNYFIENDYLKNGFAEHPNIERNYRISTQAGAIPIMNQAGKQLFSMEKKDESGSIRSDWVTILLRLLGTLMLLFYIHLICLGIAREYGALAGVGSLVVIILLLRVVTYSFPIPVNFRQFELFSPVIYGSNLVLRTLGDLLINALLLVWIALFARTQINKKGVVLDPAWQRFRYVLAAGACVALVTLTWICGSVIRSLVADSQISYDVTNFFSLNLYSIVGFIVLCCISMGFFILSLILLQFIDNIAGSSFFFKALCMAIPALLFLTLRMDRQSVGFELILLLWLLGYVYLVGTTGTRLARHISGSNIVFWLVLFSASVSVIIITQNKYREMEQRKSAAEKLAIQLDPSSEILLSITVQSLSNDFLSDNLYRFASPDQGALLKDSIINANFQGYMNKFDTRLHLFDRNEQPLSSTDPLTYDTLNTIFTMQGTRTSVQGLRYYERDFSNFSYIYRKEIRDTSGRQIASIFMLSDPRKYKSEALYPELIRQRSEFSPERWPNYAYAIYDSLELISHVNDYPFPTRLRAADLPKNEFEFREKGGNEELWYRAGGDKIVVVNKKNNLLLEAITLFSYLFCSFLFLVGIFHAANLIVRSGFQFSIVRESWNLSIRNQIYSTIIFVSIFSFVVIGAATIVFFIRRYNDNNRERLSRTIQVISGELRNRTLSGDVSLESYRVADSAGRANLQATVSGIAEIHNADINLYHTNGYLLMSSQPFVYNKGILSRLMDPVAYFQMRRQQRIQFVQDEQYGRLKYLSIYVPLRNDRREDVAFLNIPYFASNLGLNQEISNFLIAIINLNAFIFLIGGVIAVFITNRITQSLSWIGNKMREINLGRHNEAITWQRNDEIGGLVKEYNKMVRQLEESAQAMAKSEREGAWREMARQVAHEIKNPLTPMKLSIQYLQKAIDNNAPNVKELSAGVAGTLIEQIDHLSRIAAEFSQFANIGNTHNEFFDLHELMQSLVSLHSMQEGVVVHWHPVEEPLKIYADKTQMNRLFTNLLQNAVEAIPPERQGVIMIHEALNEAEVKISIQDNGLGIPTEMQSKIFTPNFTTKTSGTGLGLAMSKGIVEQFKGTLWFETKEGQGTTFFLTLPLANGQQES